MAEQPRLRVASEEQAQRYKDYLATFTSVHGARVLEDLKSECGVLAYTPGDIWETFRRTINRDFIAYIEDKILAGSRQIEVERDDVL